MRSSTDRHGYCKTPTWHSYYKMMQRCYNPNHNRYSIYHGRGITVCDRWQTFSNFLQDMGERPEGTSLDRIDNDKGYFKENCRWATAREQQQNTRKNRNLTFNGETKCIYEWGRVTGIKPNTISYRVDAGWPIEKALTTMVSRRNKNLPPKEEAQ